MDRMCQVNVNAAVAEGQPRPVHRVRRRAAWVRPRLGMADNPVGMLHNMLLALFLFFVVPMVK